MNQDKVKKPIQKRSIETRKKILEASFKAITEKGYHNTNTNEIARIAGVSTGIFYRYFPDKKAVLIALINDFFEMLEDNKFFELRQLEENNIQDFMEQTVDRFVLFHKRFPEAHEEIESLRHSDPDIALIYHKVEDTIINKLIEILLAKGVSKDHLYEKIKLVVHLLEGYCHMSGIEHNENLDLNYIKDTVIATAIQILC